MTLLFILAIRELGSSLFLYSSGTMVMAVQLLGYYEGGNIGITAAFSLVQMVLLGVLIIIINWLSRGATPGAQPVRTGEGGPALMKIASPVTRSLPASLGLIARFGPARAAKPFAPDRVCWRRPTRKARWCSTPPR